MKKCKLCKNETYSPRATYCEEHREEKEVENLIWMYNQGGSKKKFASSVLSEKFNLGDYIPGQDDGEQWGARTFA